MNPHPPRVRHGRRCGHVCRVVGLALLAGLPALVILLGVVWLPEALPVASLTRRTRILITVVAVGGWLAAVTALRTRLVRPLQTLANLLSGLREGDYSFRVRVEDRDDALGEVLFEVNALVETMREQRLGAREATALLGAVMAEIEVAVFAFDGDQRLRLVNRAGAHLLAQPAERILGRNAAELGLGDLLENDPARTVQRTFAGGAGRWRARRQQFRQGGLPHQLLVLSDLSRELREEERQAWQRLVRVLGHELNNSLAPVRSLADSLAGLVQREPLPADWRDDMRDGLAVIASRAEALNRFVGAYAQLARLPRPLCRSVAIAPLISRVVSLETRRAVTVLPGPDLTIHADPDQLEQALINLVRNAVDAVLELPPEGLPEPGDRPASRPEVRIGWERVGRFLEIRVEDDGPGLASTANLFVPFFTTKPRGSGIGLVLCRQVAEGHGGGLQLENRTDTRGCVACLRMPA